MTGRLRTILGLCLFVFVETATVSYSQLSTGSVTGVVRDSTGSVVADATVVLRNIATTVERRSVSNNVGNYVFSNVPPGRYVLETSKSGFRTAKVQEFDLQVNQTVTIDS